MAGDLPLTLLLITFAGNVYRDQSRLIAYLLEENRVFRELQGNKRPRLNDDQRRRLAAKGTALGRRLLAKVAGIVTPNTIFRWHRRLIAEHHTYPHKNRVGRPGLMKSIRALIARMATDNSRWGDLRIRGDLKKVGHTVARTTIAVDVWTKRGLVTHYVLFVIHHASRAIHIAGVTPHPNSKFMAQVARNLTDSLNGFLREMQFLVVDNDTRFTKQFCSILGDDGVQVTRTAIQAPYMNAFAERFVQTVKRECLSKLTLFGAEHLRRTLNESTARYHSNRPHQGIGNNRIAPTNDEPPDGDTAAVDERLGGLLRSYRRSV